MNSRLLNFLRLNFSKEPQAVDRLFVSAFLLLNNIQNVKNEFISDYIIDDTNVQEFEDLKKFVEQLQQTNETFDLEYLIKLFEFVISPEDRIVTGAVYTSGAIRDFIVEKSLKNFSLNSAYRLADISCGCGGFLYTAAKKIQHLCEITFYQVFKNLLFGLDIQDYSVTRTKILLSLLAIQNGEDCEEFTFNLYQGDALSFDWSLVLPHFSGFDAVVGNPPYVCSRNISTHTRQYLANWFVCSTGHPDLYIPFFQVALENLKDNGILGYITMNSFFKSLNGRALRRYFVEKSYEFMIVDFGSLQVFNSRSTYTCICIIQKRQSDFIQYAESNDVNSLGREQYVFVNYANLNPADGWNLGVHNEVLKTIEDVGIQFGKKYRTRNGIATLKNNVYIFTPAKENKKYYYLDDGEYIYSIEKAICREVVNPNFLVSIADLSKVKEKIIFPYEIVDGRAIALSEEVFKNRFPGAYEYLFDKKDILAQRDKGKGAKYSPWFMYGRSQSIDKLKYKLFFPHITNETPNFYYSSDEDLLFYNGIAVIGKNKRDLMVLKKVMASRLFWFYISNTSKPYSSSYYSLSRNYIKNFGIPDFSESEIQFLLNEADKHRLDRFIEQKYNVDLSEYFD